MFRRSPMCALSLAVALLVGATACGSDKKSTTTSTTAPGAASMTPAGASGSITVFAAASLTSL